MNKYLNLLTNIGVFALNAFATRLITFLLVPLYTYYLTTAEYGITDLSIVVLSAFFPIATLCSADAVLRFVVDKTDSTEKTISFGLFMIVLSTLVVACCLPLLDLSFFGGLGNYKLYFLLYYFFNSLQWLGGSVARGLNQIKLTTVSAVVSSLTTAIGVVILIMFQGLGVDGYFISVILANLFGSLIFIIGGRHYQYYAPIHWSKDRALIKRMLAYSIPLVPNSLFWWANTSLNRFFITGMIGIGASGLFAAASKIPNFLNLFSNIFQQAWQLSAFQEFKKQGVERFYSLILRVFHSGMSIIAAILILLAQPLALILLQKDFYSAWVYVPFLLVSFFFSALNSFMSAFYSASMKTKSLFVDTVIGLVICVVLTWLLIPPLGLYGASIAMIASNLFVYCARVFGVRKFIDIKVNWLLIFAIDCLLLTQSIVATFNFSNYLIIEIIIFVLLGVCVLLDLAPVASRVFLKSSGKYSSSK
ncbi:polysaccharide biosynthesis protein [Bifidobacterium saguini DSM 23967]|uniref:Polysaccharide biosynthesis protein n=2 Tax=Bifidobacterium saguini TaxID=762210 RepID=A0A087D918_9BIFI|nr:oligosaccharide flippase family protein [Bifidobacterium saguini]KFI92018.1 polysaccharide biosynthesis protein [Bifidobacterium saguini DSM 23967]QTB90253.1 oligosaccharide flippase family protein [Bifidobacterium saguini]